MGVVLCVCNSARYPSKTNTHLGVEKQTNTKSYRHFDSQHKRFKGVKYCLLKRL